MEQTQSENIEELAKAMVKVQAGLPGAKKSADNPFYKSKYADLKECHKAGRDILSENGLCVIQTLGGTAESPSVITTLMHVSGQWIKGENAMTPDKKGPQAIGSCITYGRRYGYSAIIGLHQEDDDGEGATNRSKSKQAPKDTSKAGVDDIPLGNEEPPPYEERPMPESTRIDKGKAKVLFAKWKNIPNYSDEEKNNLLAEWGIESLYAIEATDFEKYKTLLEGFYPKN